MRGREVEEAGDDNQCHRDTGIENGKIRTTMVSRGRNDGENEGRNGEKEVPEY